MERKALQLSHEQHADQIRCSVSTEASAPAGRIPRPPHTAGARPMATRGELQNPEGRVACVAHNLASATVTDAVSGHAITSAAISKARPEDTAAAEASARMALAAKRGLEFRDTLTQAVGARHRDSFQREAS